MFQLFHFGGGPRPPQFGTALLFNGLLCVFIGLAILVQPELLSFFVATVLLVIGASILTAWWKMRNR